jgi:dipeptidyl-peptidase-4
MSNQRKLQCGRRLRIGVRNDGLFIIILILSYCLSSLVIAQDKKNLTFDQIFKNAEPRLTTSLPFILGWADDNSYLERKRKDGDEIAKIYSIDVKSGKEKPYNFLDDSYNSIVPKDISINNPVNSTRDYKKHVYIKDSILFLLDIDKKEFKQLTDTKSDIKNPTFSPDGKFIAFTRDNDLYSINLNSGKEFRYTQDGSDVIYNGYAAWVYYEEIFGRSSNYRAFYWSPDSKKIAFYRFDEKDVPLFPIYNSTGQHGFLENTRYPKAGDKNPDVKFGIVNVEQPKIVWADFNENDDQYFGTPFWNETSKSIFVQWMNRDQTNIKIYSIDPNNGNKIEITDEKQTSWVNWYEGIKFLKKDKGFLLTSDKSGYSHIYWYSSDGKNSKQLTNGKWSVSQIESIDEEKSIIYFSAKKETSLRTDLYSVDLNGKNLNRISFGNYTHRINSSPNGKYFIATYSNSQTPTKIAIIDNKGKILKELGDSKTKEFDNYNISKSTTFTIETTDGYKLPAIWTLPIDFDENKKYPVLFQIYGGPGSPSVADSWSGIRNQWLAIEGVITIAVDHRGTGHFGKESMALMHRNLGKWEINDYIEAVKWLYTKPFVDKTKICITGGSYGGYATCMALTAGADYFTHGIAQFSVTSWELYDSYYTEKYMDTPEDNPEGYKYGSVLTHANKLKGKLQIIHGTMDDNVHMQNSIQLIDKLQDLGKHFEFMLYPGERHGWGGLKATFLRNETYRFYYKYLLEKEFPEQLFSSPAGMGRR